MFLVDTTDGLDLLKHLYSLFKKYLLPLQRIRRQNQDFLLLLFGPYHLVGPKIIKNNILNYFVLLKLFES